MNRTNYLRKGEPRAKYKHLVIVFLLLVAFANSMAFGQFVDSVSIGTTKPEVVSLAANGLYLTVLSITVAILAALATIAILIPSILAIGQIRRVEKQYERFKGIADEADLKMIELRENIREYRPPSVILKDAAEKAEKITEYEVKSLREFISVVEDNLKESLGKLQTSVEKEKVSLDELTTAVNIVKLELEKKPSTSDILVQVGDKYKIPDDLMEIVLHKVGLALLCLQNLTKEERREIMNVLTVNPKISDEKD